MHLQQLKFFVVVARYEHMSKAAEFLNISQPALSTTIKKLEQELGVPLFERHGRNIKLNSYGQDFLEHVAPAIRQLDRAAQSVRAMQQIQDNRITIVAPPLYSFPTLMSTLRASFPNLTIQNVDCPHEMIHQNLIQGKVEFCILSQSIRSEDIASAVLAEDELVMLVPEGHPLAGRASASLIEFADEQFADYPEVTAIQSNRAVLCQRAGFQSKVTCEGRTLYDLIDAVRYSSCVALLPYRVLGLYRLDGTYIVPISDPNCKSSLCLYWKKGNTERLVSQQVRLEVLRYFESYRRSSVPVVG